MSIQRFDLVNHTENYEDAEMIGFPDGDYVLFTDHAAEVERLTAERDSYRACLDGLEMREMDKMATEGPAMAAAIGSEMSRVIKSIMAERDAAVAVKERAEAFIKALSEESLCPVDKGLATKFLLNACHATATKGEGDE